MTRSLLLCLRSAAVQCPRGSPPGGGAPSNDMCIPRRGHGPRRTARGLCGAVVVCARGSPGGLWCGPVLSAWGRGGGRLGLGGGAVACVAGVPGGWAVLRQQRRVEGGPDAPPAPPPRAAPFPGSLGNETSPSFFFSLRTAGGHRGPDSVNRRRLADDQHQSPVGGEVRG